MPQVDFFAARNDQLALLCFLFAETDLHIFESASRIDAELREFRSPEEVDEAFTLGSDPRGGGTHVLLALWSPSVMGPLEIRWTDFDPAKVPNARGRYFLAATGEMQLYFGGVVDQVITKSHFGHNSEVRARRWDVDQGVDWPGLARLSRRIQYHIRTRMSVVRVPGRPVLPQAAMLWQEGYKLKDGANWSHRYEISGLVRDV